MKEKRFKKGDKVTYKNLKDCVGEYGYKGEYYYTGDDQGGFVGRIYFYYDYIEDKGCWRIRVTTKDGGQYNMLESEFLEYDKQPTNELFPIY
jgi:hypothetical protein